MQSLNKDSNFARCKGCKSLKKNQYYKFFNLINFKDKSFNL